MLAISENQYRITAYVAAIFSTLFSLYLMYDVIIKENSWKNPPTYLFLVSGALIIIFCWRGALQIGKEIEKSIENQDQLLENQVRLSEAQIKLLQAQEKLAKENILKRRRENASAAGALRSQSLAKKIKKKSFPKGRT